jgi:DNA mismatch repair protein MutS2
LATEFKEIKNLDWDEILNHLTIYATALPTKSQIQKIEPFKTKKEAESSFEQIENCQRIINAGVRPFMESLDLFEPWFLKLKKQSVLLPLEFKDIRHFCFETIALKELFKATQTKWFTEQNTNLMNAEEPLSAIESVFTSGGDIRNDASETLYNLYKEKEALARQIHSTLDKLVKDYDMVSYLQDKYVTTRDGRWVIPVKGGSQHQVKGMIQAHSQSKQTVFIEPEEVIQLNNRLRQVEWSIEQEVERILTELTHYLSSKVSDFQLSREVLLIMDFKLAQAQLANKLSAEMPIFLDECLDLKELKHPLLLLNTPQVIPNSVLLNKEKSILLLTGPNAGGKTVLLKSLGLAAQMARCGMFICAAPQSKIPFFNRIITAIGDSQSVDEHLSTFAAHLKILDNATHLENSDSLLLVDEICGSTDPDEGSALGRSFLESFASQKIFAVVTSHLGPLKTGWTKESAVLQGSLQYDEKSGRPTYQFIAGIAGSSMALQTAKRVGVSSLILKRAYELLSPELRAHQQAMEDIESLKNDLMMTQKDLLRRTHEAELKLKKYDSLVKDFEKEKTVKLEKLLTETRKDVDEKIKHAQVDNTFKKFRQLEQIKQDLPEIIKASSPDVDSSSVTSSEEFIKRYPSGTKVYIPSLNQDGIIQGMPNSKGEIPVLSNSLQVLIHWKLVKPPEKPNNPTAQILRKSTQFSIGLGRDQDRALDLRGETVDSALLSLERELDIAMQRGEDRMRVIHGHGTEALKRAVRAYLSRSLYVKKWKAGTPETGGDGMTWIEIGKE